jgi:thiol-disulfide isomerase/thioredoxin
MLYLSQEEELTWKQELQILYFYATWLPYHQKSIVMLDWAQQKYPLIAFFAIDVDFFKGFVKRYGILTAPTILIFRQGREVKRLTDQLIPTSDFIAVLDDI